MPSYVQQFSVVQKPDSNPLRRVQAGTYKGRSIEVVTAYDASRDQWRVHIYLAETGAAELTKQSIGDLFGVNERDAFAAGWSDVERIAGDWS